MRDKYNHLNIKLTPQRIGIFEYLEGNTCHPSALDIHRALKDRFPTMSLATVYSTLEMLIEKGVIQALGIDVTKKRFDPNTSPHHHLICIHCKTVVDIHYGLEIDLPPEDSRGYEIIGNHVDFFGLCLKCKTGAQ